MERKFPPADVKMKKNQGNVPLFSYFMGDSAGAFDFGLGVLIGFFSATRTLGDSCEFAGIFLEEKDIYELHFKDPHCWIEEIP